MITENQALEKLSLILVKADLLTKSELKQSVAQFVSELSDEGLHMRKILARAVRNAEFWNTIAAEVRQPVFDEIQRMGSKETMVDGVKMALSQTTRYDYSNDPTWRKLNDQIEAIKEDQKKLEAMLKARTKMTVEVDETTGEEFQMGFAIKSSSDTIKTSW